MESLVNYPGTVEYTDEFGRTFVSKEPLLLEVDNVSKALKALDRVRAQMRANLQAESSGEIAKDEWYVEYNKTLRTLRRVKHEIAESMSDLCAMLGNHSLSAIGEAFLAYDLRAEAIAVVEGTGAGTGAVPIDALPD